ncbi:peptidoglycan DD-metalloendopeptidase family protein [Thermodesulfobacteriota bacterium]
MRKHINFFILSSTGSPARHLTLSKTLLRVFGLLFVVFILFSGVIIYDYTNLKQRLMNNQELEQDLSSLRDEIANQRQQIQTFAGHINSLKSELIALNDFEKKIRIIANIEKTDGQDSLFGVGGSIPADLDPRIPLQKTHNSLIRGMHEQAQQLEEATLNQKDGFGSLYKFLEDHRNLLASTPAIWPTRGWTTSGFGYRTSPFTGLREFHKGLDVATRKDTPIIATADGTVTYVGTKGFLGKTIVIDHGHGMATRYAHINKALKKRGDVVKRGDTVALVGSSGRTTGPHLHYEILLNGIPVNPKKYILN